jgi:hypothetical protein
MNQVDKDFLESLPRAKLVLAYGSGVFPQLGADRLVTQRTRDYMLVVDNPTEWLLEAVDRQPEHFPWWLQKLRRPEVFAWLQRQGARMFFIPPIALPVPTAGAIKYGIIAEKDLLADIQHWCYFYAAGRLQKPIEIVLLSNMHQNEADTCARQLIETNQSHNLLQATRLGILLCAEADIGPRMVPVSTLLEHVVGLSYAADIRMHVGMENPNKVRNIVRANLDRLLAMYGDALTQIQHDELVKRTERSSGDGLQTKSLPWRADDLLDLSELYRCDARGSQLRSQLLNPLLRLPLFKGIQPESELKQQPSDFPGARARFQGPVVIEYFGQVLGALLRRRVLKSSISQACKGFITAGPSRSLQYVWGKWRRRWS